MQVTINTKRLTRTLFICLVSLFLVNLVLMLVTGLRYRGLLLNQLFHKFYFDSKFNLPSFFNTLLLLIATGILYYVHIAYARKYVPELKWFWLAVLFFLMAIEENVSVHVFLGTLQPSFLAWVIPVGVALIALVAYFGQLVYKVLRKIAIGFVMSGIVYTTGAIVLQLTGARLEPVVGKWSAVYAGISTLEETLEMLGVIMFIHYMLEYVKIEFPTVNVIVK